MNEFLDYLKLGIEHILDADGLDHFYFIIAFSLLYTYKNWKVLLTLVTAFTVGHSITLALSAFDIIRFPPNIIETLIPITILITLFNNFRLIFFNKTNQKTCRITYTILLFFGFIHGMGFSSFLHAITFEEESIIVPLLALNIGIEISQVIIVLVAVGIISLVFCSLDKIQDNTIQSKKIKKSILFVINCTLTLLVLKMML